MEDMEDMEERERESIPQVMIERVHDIRHVNKSCD